MKLLRDVTEYGGLTLIISFLEDTSLQVIGNKWFNN